MDRTRLTRILRDLAVPLGYRYRTRTALFWKRGQTLTRLLHLPQSSWGKAVYVNFGVTPNRLLPRATPGASDIELSLRAPA